MAKSLTINGYKAVQMVIVKCLQFKELLFRGTLNDWYNL